MLQVEAAPALLVSKLYPPRLTNQHIPRQRLIDQLERYSDRPLILVCAPAGSGKSTLLSEWVAGTNTPSAWVSLDERDDDPVTFLGYVIAALHATLPVTDFNTRDLLRAPVPPPIEALATSLSNDLDQIAVDFLLVLDDYHLVTNAEIHELLVRLLRHPPRRMHLIVATRAEPSWPLPMFRTRGQVIELRFSDLEFTADESAAYLRKALGDNLAESVVAALHSESEGWVAGLHLMALAAGHDRGLLRVWDELGASGDISAYLFSEVLNSLPARVQSRLLQL